MPGRILFRLLVLRYYRRDRLVSVLAILGIALGIAGFTAIDVANQQAFHAFRTSANRVVGAAIFSVTSAGGGIDEKLITTLRTVPGVEEAIPLSAGYATDGETTLKIVGFDVVSAQRLGISISSSEGRNGVVELLKGTAAAAVPVGFNRTARDHNVRINGRPVALDLIADYLLPPGSPIEQGAYVVDISTFQELFGTIGTVDSFEIIPMPGAEPDDLRRQITAKLPPGIELQNSADRANFAARITEAFRLNLQFLSVISLFVAALLIYNNTSAVILRRRSDFGVLLSLGLTPKRLFTILLIESCFLGLIGSIVGAILGWLFSSSASSSVLETISNLYFPVEIRNPAFQPKLLAKALWLGPLTAVAGSLFPLLEIREIPLRDTFGYQTVETRFLSRVPKMTVCGVALILVSALLCLRPLAQFGPYYGFIPPLILMAGAALLAPSLTLAAARTGRIVLGHYRPVESLLSSDHLQRTLRRNSVAVCSAMIALGMLWGLATMVRSFRDSVDQWISYITKADLYVSAGTIVRGDRGVGIDPELVKRISNISEIDEIDSVQALELRGQFPGARIIGSRFDLIEKYHRLLPIGQWLDQTDDSVLISEPFANHFKVKAGDKIDLPTPSGLHSFRVRGVYLDYSSDSGVITIPDSLFVSLYGNKPKTALSLYLKPGSNIDAVADEIGKLEGGNSLAIRNGAGLRNQTLDVFDRTFRITDVLLGIALAVAVFAILNAVMLSLSERRRELVVLRAIGASRAALLKTIAVEALLMGSSSAVGGLLFGGAMSAILVYVVNFFFFGWSTGYSVPASFVAFGAIGSVFLATIVALIPAERFLKQLDSKEIRYE